MKILLANVKYLRTRTPLYRTRNFAVSEIITPTINEAIGYNTGVRNLGSPYPLDFRNHIHWDVYKLSIRDATV